MNDPALGAPGAEGGRRLGATGARAQRAGARILPRVVSAPTDWPVYNQASAPLRRAQRERSELRVLISGLGRET